MSGDLLSIGDVAQRAGFRTSALRFYEEAGLLRPAARVGGRRRYAPSVLRRLAVIRLLGEAGFAIREMRQLVGEGPRRPWRPLAERKLREVEAQIAEAQETRRLLERALACDCESLEGCSSVTESYGAHRAAPSRKGNPLPKRRPPL